MSGGRSLCRVLDLVTLFQVLEHLSDPVEDIRSMSEFLKPDGLFVIEVPDILFPGMRIDHKWHDGHLYGFDWLTLEAVAAKAGLKSSLSTSIRVTSMAFSRKWRRRSQFQTSKATSKRRRSRFFEGGTATGRCPIHTSRCQSVWFIAPASI